VTDRTNHVLNPDKGVFEMNGTDAGALRAVVSTLNRTTRSILMLFYADELTAAEIGLVLDLPESEVLATLDRLRKLACATLGGPRPTAAAGVPLGAG
jgi:DNA-directed RNA polymerase specialized sigma24 family protein